MRKRVRDSDGKYVSVQMTRKLGVNAACMMTATGRIDLPAKLRTQQDDGEETYWGKLEVMADSSTEPLDRLIALEEAEAQGIDEQTARTALGMYR